MPGAPSTPISRAADAECRPIQTCPYHIPREEITFIASQRRLFLEQG